MRPLRIAIPLLICVHMYIRHTQVISSEAHYRRMEELFAQNKVALGKLNKAREELRRTMEHADDVLNNKQKR